MVEAAELFAELLTLPVERLAIENPVMHKHARAAIERALQARGSHAPICDAMPRQSIQPWQFGEMAFKRTCLWLRGLPALVTDPTEVLRPPKAGEVGHKEWSACHREPPGPRRWQIRSQTYPGIARAMAEQWGG